MSEVLGADLAKFDQPPVVEIVGAAQFVAIPRLTLPDLVRLGTHLEDYTLQDLQGELPPMSEAEPGRPDPPQFLLGLGSPTQRALYASSDSRFIAQLQRDRIAINDRRVGPTDADPSSENVWPRLKAFSERVDDLLVDQPSRFGPGRPTFVELTYVNVIHPAGGVWETHADLHRVLRILNGVAGDPPFDRLEHAAVRFSFPLHNGDVFAGRVHVNAEPGFTPEGTPTMNLSLFSRRIVDPDREDLEMSFAAAHRDVVNVFVAITTPEMQEHWGRKT